MTTTAHQAMSHLEQTYSDRTAGKPDAPLTPLEIALRDALRAWVDGGRK